MDRHRYEDGGATANDRFKAQWGSWLWGGIALATALHFVVLIVGPGLAVPDRRAASAGEPFNGVRLAPPTEIPAPPAPIAAPALPEVESLDTSFQDEMKFEPVRFEQRWSLAAEIPPPPTPSSPADELPGYREFVPSMVAPELKNPDEVRRILQREYPSRLAGRGIGGRVVLWFWIDETGEVERYEIKESSGRPELDEAALRVVDRMEFSPALQEGREVKVLVALPINFVAP